MPNATPTAPAHPLDTPVCRGACDDRPCGDPGCCALPEPALSPLAAGERIEAAGDAAVARAALESALAARDALPWDAPRADRREHESRVTVASRAYSDAQMARHEALLAAAPAPVAQVSCSCGGHVCGNGRWGHE